MIFSEEENKKGFRAVSDTTWLPCQFFCYKRESIVTDNLYISYYFKCTDYQESTVPR